MIALTVTLMIIACFVCYYLTERLKVPVLYQSYYDKEQNRFNYRPFMVNSKSLKQFKVERYYQQFSIYIRVGKINKTVEKLNKREI